VSSVEDAGWRMGEGYGGVDICIYIGGVAICSSALSGESC